MQTYERDGLNSSQSKEAFEQDEKAMATANVLLEKLNGMVAKVTFECEYYH